MPRPQVTLKLATSLDGKIALANGQSEWITGEKSRAAGRKLRARHDAIAIGSNTAVIDNPQLTTRISGEPDPIRVVFDTNLRLSPKSNLALTANETPVWVFTKSAQGNTAKSLKDLGVQLFEVKAVPRLDVHAALTILKERGISTLLLEGGGTLAASFIALGVVDVIEWFRAPIILGANGRSGIGPLELKDLSLAERYSRIDLRELGDDVYERYERAK